MNTRALYTVEDDKERVILVGVDTSGKGQPVAAGGHGRASEAEEALKELAELARTAGAEVLSSMIQASEEIHPATYVGSGKLQEIKAVAETLGATGIICDDELSSVQLRNLEQALELKIMDRTLVILDILARYARSREGRIQVELAQLR
jgi:GTP-binding protein HflX